MYVLDPLAGRYAGRATVAAPDQLSKEGERVGVADPWAYHLVAFATTQNAVGHARHSDQASPGTRVTDVCAERRQQHLEREMGDLGILEIWIQVGDHLSHVATEYPAWLPKLLPWPT
jgi:hypothetical protein